MKIASYYTYSDILRYTNIYISIYQLMYIPVRRQAGARVVLTWEDRSKIGVATVKAVLLGCSRKPNGGYHAYDNCRSITVCFHLPERSRL
jgi:hypothetical protein